jgi:hypothetical protein
MLLTWKKSIASGVMKESDITNQYYSPSVYSTILLIGKTTSGFLGMKENDIKHQ